jgi:anti-sigma factor RsiW
MNCHQVTKVISAYVDGELTGHEMLAIRSHVLHCEECGEEMESIRRAKVLLSRLRTMEPRAGFADQILANLGDSKPGPYQRLLSAIDYNLRRRISPVAAALAVAGLAMVVLTPRGAGWPVPQLNQSTLVARSPFVVGASNDSVFDAGKSDVVGGFPQKPLMVSDSSEIAHSVNLVSFSYR